MKYIISGLGNVGTEYKSTRHNVGFLVLDHICSELKINFTLNKKLKSEIALYKNLIFVKPQTYMNNSGLAISTVASFYKVLPENIYVIHDDVDLNLFELKKQFGKDSAGHHGVEDIFEKIKSKDIWRYRIGIGRPEDKRVETTDWVLSKFSQAEMEEIKIISKNIMSEIQNLE